LPIFFSTLSPHPISTLFPYTTLFRSYFNELFSTEVLTSYCKGVVSSLLLPLPLSRYFGFWWTLATRFGCHPPSPAQFGHHPPPPSPAHTLALPSRSALVSPLPSLKQK